MNTYRHEWRSMEKLNTTDRKSCLKDLLTRIVYLPGDAQISRGKLAVDGKLTINQWRDPESGNYIPVFTSLGRIQRSILLPSTVLSIQARDLFRILRMEHIVINPGYPDWIDFSPQERWKIAPPGFWSRKNKLDMKNLKLKRSMILPLKLQEDIRKYLRRIKAVRNAYIQSIQPPKEGVPMKLFLTLEYRGDGERLTEQIKDVVKFSLAGEPLELVIATGDFGLLPEEIYQLFYKRRKAWDLL